MNNRQLCPVCYPVQPGELPREAALIPDACPARKDHDNIRRLLSILWQLEGRVPTPINLESAAQVQADLDMLRDGPQH